MTEPAELDVMKLRKRLIFKDAPKGSHVYVTCGKEGKRFDQTLDHIYAYLPLLYEGDIHIRFWEHIETGITGEEFKRYDLTMHTREIESGKFEFERKPTDPYTVVMDKNAMSIKDLYTYVASLPVDPADMIPIVEPKPPKPLIEIGKEHLLISVMMAAALVALNLMEFSWLNIAVIMMVAPVFGWHAGCALYKRMAKKRDGKQIITMTNSYEIGKDE